MSRIHGLPDSALLWVCSALVMVMQAGFCCMESGLVRSKNSINVAIKNVVDFCIAALMFWMFGYAVMYGESHAGLVGTSGFLFNETTDSWLLSFFLFQLVFCGTATTVISGAVAERMRFVAYIVVAVMVSGLIYPVFGHWAWGGQGDSSGWLKALGFVDFAGATVVHSTGGWVALASVILIGSRTGRFGADARPFHGHNLPLAALGVLLLWFGWFGFNGGSTHAATGAVSGVLVKTVLGGAAGGVAAVMVSVLWLGRPQIELVLNGVIAGLVGITAGCHVLTVPAAVLVGAVAAAICIAATFGLEKLKIDDVLGAVPAHACAGAWGTMAVALLGNPLDWPNGHSRLQQLGVQTLGVGVCFVWSFGVGFGLLWLINHLLPLRINTEGEEIGLNILEHGAHNSISDLIDEMARHRQEGEFTRHVKIEPYADVAPIAQAYNQVLDRVNREISTREEVSDELRDKNLHLQLLQTVAAAANEATNTEEAFLVILEEICAHTGWPVGHVYSCDRNDPQRLKPSRLWYLRHPQQFHTFKTVTEKTSFDIGEGLPGRVLASGTPAWIIDVTKDENFPRAKLAKDIGVKAGFAFPVLVGSEVVAVLEFFSSQAVQPNEPLLRVMANVGTQLGRVIERRRAEEDLRRMAEHDQLTGLVNRQLFNKHLGEAIKRAQLDSDYLFAVLFLDVDRFKVVNDSLGHDLGDKLLVSIANRIQKVMAGEQWSGGTTDSHVAGRLGGDEFVVLLKGIDPDDPVQLANQLQKSLSAAHYVAGREISMTASIGIATNKDGYECPEDALRDADLAMYHAKARGKATYAVFDRHMHEQVVERLNLETDLRRALDDQQFRLQYQPIVCLSSGELIGFEALLRWHHPRQGMIPPDRFVPIAEETGLIVPIGSWVIKTAIEQLGVWHRRYPQQASASMNINLSKNQLIQPGVVELIREVLGQSGVRPEAVKLEVTESMIMDNTETVTPVLEQLRALGTKLAMDDFGTGHSSLGNLYRFPIDVLKIDRSFINVMDENRGYAAIVFAIVTLAHNLGMVVVAEGIETGAQIAELQALECDRGQGYFFACPLDANKAEGWLNGSQRLARPA